MIRIQPWGAAVAMAAIAPIAVLAGSAGPATAAVSSQALAHRHVALCPAPPHGYAHCHAILNQAVTAAGQPAPDSTGSPTGLSPAQYLQAYGWTNASNARVIGDGTGQTIAVVDAYDDPTIASDLAAFSSKFAIPCNSCFTKVNQTGGSSYPSANSGWALEIALDVEWAHAIAPNAHILLVEANDSTFNNLLAAEDYASGHARYVTNSWGGSEFSGESSYDSHFSTPGVSFFASSGDTGGVVEYPAASSNVIAVGGTSLSYSSSTGTWSESAWSSGGGGCSAYESANSAQVSAPVSCSRRATPDVASDADPNSGVSVYDTTSYQGQSGWFQVGGTSAASPVWAARSADRGSQVNAAYVYAGYTGTQTSYGTDITYRDVTSGSNGYAAGTGFDLATGLGTWIGGDGSGSTTVSPPSGLSAAANGTSVSLSWSASSTAGAAYDVYRSAKSGSELSGSPIATGLTNTRYTDGSPGNGTWYYEVTAVSSGVSSGPSNEASATIGSTGSPATITSKSCSGATCNFAGTGSNPLNWSFGDGGTGTGGSVSHSYTATGTFRVTLTAGNSSQATTSVTCSLNGSGKHRHLVCA